MPLQEVRDIIDRIEQNNPAGLFCVVLGCFLPGYSGDIAPR